MDVKSERFDAIIIDPDSASRMRLKQATTSVMQFNKVLQCSGMQEAKAKTAELDTIHVYFLSSMIDKEEVDRFIANAKVSKNSQDAAFVSILKGSMQQSGDIAGTVLAGFDGLLFEPYSVDQLVSLTEIAARVRKERSTAREEAAFKMLLEDYMNLINRAAYVKSQGLDSSNIMKKLTEGCLAIKRMQSESLQIYLSAAVDAFVEAPFPTQLYERKAYAGASKRIKKKSSDLLEEVA